MALAIAGFAIAQQFLPGSGKALTGGSVGKAHDYLGTVVMGLAGLQVRGGYGG
jgi:hypothetical protein